MFAFSVVVVVVEFVFVLLLLFSSCLDGDSFSCAIADDDEDDKDELVEIVDAADDTPLVELVPVEYAGDIDGLDWDCVVVFDCIFWLFNGEDEHEEDDDDTNIDNEEDNDADSAELVSFTIDDDSVFEVSVTVTDDIPPELPPFNCCSVIFDISILLF